MGEIKFLPFFMQQTAIESFHNLTTELSKLQNDLVNSTIRSYDADLNEMSLESIFEAAQELIWMAQDLQGEQENIMEIEEDVFSDEIFIDDIIEEAEKYLLEISDLI